MRINKTKFLGAMIFLTILMDVVPHFGFTRIGSISITVMHIPPILSSIVLGPISGMLIGLLFGIISLMRAVSRESAVLDTLLQNPLISVLPRVIFPLISGKIYQFLMEHFATRRENIAVGASALVGACCNSVLVLSMLYLIYPDRFLSVMQLDSGQNVLVLLLNAFGPNLLVEALLALAVCIGFMYLLHRREAKKQSGPSALRK